MILFARIFLGCIFAGRFSSILYAGAGGLLAIGMTALCKCFLTRKQLWVAGVLGAIAHSIGQLIAAAWITGTLSVWIYLPILLVSAAASTPLGVMTYRKLKPRTQQVACTLLVVAGLVVCTAYLVASTYNPFLYFRF